MTIRNTYVAEAWDKVYSAFEQVNFSAFDYDTVKSSLLQYLKIYHAENFNDFIESGDLVAVLEIFAMVAEMLAYRVDMLSHENFITTAQRKQSILKLARLISYRASRNIPARGLVKLNTVSTTEQVFDSLGNDLANQTVTWNDPNNSNWKEQFFLVMNKLMTTKYGQPQKAFQVGDVNMQMYTYDNSQDAFKNGVVAFTAGGVSETLTMEVVPADLDENGPFERAPDLNSQMSLLFASDGKGDGSDYTGFMMFLKQGTLLRTDYTILEPTENRRVELDASNINDTDVWVYRVDDNGSIVENWKRVETLSEQNLVFNNDDARKKYEVETLENDRIALLFGDGDFSDAPVGDFQIWTRISLNQSITIPKSQIQNQRMAFSYLSDTGIPANASLTFSLTAAMQNNAASEQIEHIRQAAPATYYAQNRMVNGQDHNTYMLKDPTILKLKTVNRTFAGQPKYIEWNDASRAYENVKLFGDDLRMSYEVSIGDVTSTQSARTLIDTYLEPLLSSTGVFNILNYVSSTHPDGYGIVSFPRRTFIEDNRSKNALGDSRYLNTEGDNVNPFGDLVASSSTIVDGSLKEKTAIQGALDRHFYGEPESFVSIGGIRHGVIQDPTTVSATSDGKLYDEALRRTIDGVNTWPPGDTGSGLQSVANEPYFGIKFNRFLTAFGSENIDLISTIPDGLLEFKDRIEVITVEVQADGTTLSVISNLRGAMKSGRIGTQYSTTVAHAPFDFFVPAADEELGQIPFQQGDAFVIELSWNGLANRNVDPNWMKENTTGQYHWVNKLRTFGGQTKTNLNGWFELVSHNAVGVDPISVSSWSEQKYNFDPLTGNSDAWIFLVVREDDSFGNPQSFRILYREMKLVVESPTTKFWYNQNSQIIDSETKKVVYDKIRILRSNLDAYNRPLVRNHVYDVVSFVYDDDGVVETTKLEVLPTDSISFTKSGEGLIDNLMQFENFSGDAYQFGLLVNGQTIWMECGDYLYMSGYDMFPYDTTRYDAGVFEVISGPYAGLRFYFYPGAFFSKEGTNTGNFTLVRRRSVPSVTLLDTTPVAKCNPTKGLDFMWQHFSPITNLIDPSTTNIHDSFILARGYYDSMIEYVRGISNIIPTPPTPLELRTSYAGLLKNKMLSDTIVLHPGSIKLLFGQLAAPQLRAKFRVIKSPTASFSSERIKTEIIAVINTFFNIQNWDFGDKFYATELISLIHQRLGSQISSVVLVPMYSVNSFGSLFTIDSGFDEILQSCATVNDVEIVDALTPTVLRQLK